MRGCIENDTVDYTSRLHPVDRYTHNRDYSRKPISAKESFRPPNSNLSQAIILLKRLNQFQYSSIAFLSIKSKNPFKNSKNYFHNKYYFAFSKNSAEEQHDEF
jgi:hypothetical protein